MEVQGIDTEIFVVEGIPEIPQPRFIVEFFNSNPAPAESMVLVQETFIFRKVEVVTLKAVPPAILPKLVVGNSSSFLNSSQ